MTEKVNLVRKTFGLRTCIENGSHEDAIAHLLDLLHHCTHGDPQKDIPATHLEYGSREYFFYLHKHYGQDPEPVAVEQFEHWGNHPDYPIEDWRHEVADDNTRLGYHEWVDHQREIAEMEDE